MQRVGSVFSKPAKMAVAATEDIVTIARNPRRTAVGRARDRERNFKEVRYEAQRSAFGLACGLTWGLGVFCLAWWMMAFEGATAT